MTSYKYSFSGRSFSRTGSTEAAVCLEFYVFGFSFEGGKGENRFNGDDALIAPLYLLMTGGALGTPMLDRVEAKTFVILGSRRARDGRFLMAW